MRNSLPPAVLLAITAGILLVVTFGKLPGDTKLSGALQNAGHAPAFCLLSIAVLKLLASRGPTAFSVGVRHYAATFGLCLLAGVLIEWVQALTGRDMSLTDMGADALGILCGLSGHAYLHARSSGRWARKVSLLSVCAGSAVLAIAPLAWTVAAYLNRSAQFPVIADFDSPLDRYFVSAHGIDARVSLAGTPEEAMQVTVDPEHPGEYPGIAFYEPAPNWSGYETLVIDLANPDAQPLKLTLRIHDRRHNKLFADRYNLTFVITPLDATRIRVPTNVIKAAPAGREMDMTQIATLILFGDPSLAGRKFELRGIWLE